MNQRRRTQEASKRWVPRLAPSIVRKKQVETWSQKEEGMVKKTCTQRAAVPTDSPDRTVVIGTTNAEALPSTHNEAATVENFMVSGELLSSTRCLLLLLFECTRLRRTTEQWGAGMTERKPRLFLYIHSASTIFSIGEVYFHPRVFHLQFEIQPHRKAHTGNRV